MSNFCVWHTCHNVECGCRGSDDELIVSKFKSLKSEVKELTRRNKLLCEDVAKYEQKISYLDELLVEAHLENTCLKNQLLDIEEKEASVCPEDRGFVEHIKSLEARLAKTTDAAVHFFHCVTCAESALQECREGYSYAVKLGLIRDVGENE